MFDVKKKKVICKYRQSASPLLILFQLPFFPIFKYTVLFIFSTRENCVIFYKKHSTNNKKDWRKKKGEVKSAIRRSIQ